MLTFCLFIICIIVISTQNITPPNKNNRALFPKEYTDKLNGKSEIKYYNEEVSFSVILGYAFCILILTFLIYYLVIIK